MMEVTCEEGDYIIRQGEDGDHFYLVVSPSSCPTSSLPSTASPAAPGSPASPAAT